MIDLIFEGLKRLYEEYKNVMEFADKLGAYEEEGEDLAERIGSCVIPCVLRLEGNLTDDLMPSLCAMKRILQKSKVWALLWRTSGLRPRCSNTSSHLAPLTAPFRRGPRRSWSTSRPIQAPTSSSSTDT